MVDYGITRGGTITGPVTISGSAPAGKLLYVKNTASAPTDHTIVLEGVNATDRALGLLATGDVQDRHNMTISGLTQWGNGAGGLDTNLYRNAAQSLTTDDSLVTALNLTASGVALPSGAFLPSDHGYQAWSGDPENIQGATVLVAGTVYLRKLHIRRALTPTTLAFSISVAASTITAGQNFAGLYSSAGTRLATVGIDAEIAGTGVQAVTIAPGALTAQSFVWAAIVTNATTPPQLHRMTSTTTPPNAGLSAATFRNAVNGTLQTSLPATITPASNSATGAITWWAALA